MTQAELVEAVAEATGESNQTIRNLGFSFCDNRSSLVEQVEEHEPSSLDWETGEPDSVPSIVW